MSDIGVSSHDHGNCELCDHLDRQRDTLLARVAHMHEELDRTLAESDLRRTMYEQACAARDSYFMNYEVATARVAALETALRRYGRHDGGCQFIEPCGIGDCNCRGQKCTCGLTAALAEPPEGVSGLADR